MHLRTPLFLLSAILPTLGALGYFVVFSASPFANEVYAGVKIVMIALALVGWHMSGQSLRGLMRPTRQQVLAGIAWGVGMASVVFLAFFIMQSALLPFTGAVSAKLTLLIPLAWYIPATITFSVFHSLFEEWYWRGYIFTELARKMPVFLAAVFGALAFTGHHIVILSQLFSWPIAALASAGVFLGGIFWSLTLRKTSSLIPSWISHIFVDLAIFAVGYAMIFFVV